MRRAEAERGSAYRSAGETRLTPASQEEPLHLPLEVLEGGLLGGLSRVNHDPPSRPEQFQTEPHRFTHAAFDSIPSGALTQSPGRRETDPGPLVSARVQTKSG